MADENGGSAGEGCKVEWTSRGGQDVISGYRRLESLTERGLNRWELDG